MVRKLFRRLRLRRSEEEGPDELGEKLKGLNWKSGDDESEEAMRRREVARSSKDGLAETAFRGRPSNPLAGED